MPEGLLVWTYNNPSVSRADSSLCTREPVLGEALYADSGRGGSLPSLCKERWHTECTEGLSVRVSTVFQAAERIENKN